MKYKIVNFFLFILVASLAAAFYYFTFGYDDLLKRYESIASNPIVSEFVNFQKSFLSAKNPDTVDHASILVLGDMMLDRHVREKIEANGYDYPFVYLKNMLKGHEEVIVNSEGSFTAYPSETAYTKDAPFKFTFDPAALSVLKNLGFTALGLANNHSDNFGRDGIVQTHKNIEENGLKWFGDPSNKDIRPYVTTVHGQRIAFIGYNDFSADEFDRLLLTIQLEKNDGAFVVVYPHWGEEYNEYFTEHQAEEAHAMIDIGADLVIGSHPHVIEPIEIYNGKLIFYSLGNFVFDQSSKGLTSEGLALGLNISKNNVGYYIFPLNVGLGQTSLMNSEERHRILEKLSDNSVNAERIKENIKTGYFEYGR